jgi:hypothetical protein
MEVVMARRARVSSSAVLALGVVVVATGAWSCGGGVESPTAPAAVVVAGGDEPGAVAESKSSPKVTICHKGMSVLTVAASALPAHLAHGDRVGTCAPDPVSCPCFSAAGIAQVAALCTGALHPSCPEQYSIQLWCSPVPSLDWNLGLFAAKLGTDTCSTASHDPLTGDEIFSETAITPAQYEACRQAIVTTPVYPTSCPR